MFKKTAALLLAASFIALALTSCGGSKPAYLTDENGNPVKVDTIMTVDGEKVPLEEFRYYFLSTKTYYDQMAGETPEEVAAFWKEQPELGDSLKEQVSDNIVFTRAINKYAKQNDISLTAEEKRAVTDEINAAIKEQGSPSKFRETLAAQFMTDKLYKSLREGQLLQQKLQTELLKPGSKIAPTEEEAKTAIMSDYLRSKHILISTQGITDEAEIAAKKEIADEALERAQAGEDFDALVAEYGEDPGMGANPDGYVFTDGDMVPEFYEGTKALADNAVSGLVQSDFGWHIIQRLPLDDAYYEANKDTLGSLVVSSVAGPKLDEDIRAIMEAMEVVKAPEYDMITVDSLK